MSLHGDRVIGGAAKRRRDRRLRMHWRHEQLTLQMVLALHGDRRQPPGPGQRSARHTQRHGDRSPPLPAVTAGTKFLHAGRRERAGDGVAADRSGRAAGDHRSGFRGNTMEQFGELAPMVQILDAPVPQMVDKLEDVLKIVDLYVPVQEIEVPKISSLSCPPPRRVLPVRS